MRSPVSRAPRGLALALLLTTVSLAASCGLGGSPAEAFAPSSEAAASVRAGLDAGVPLLRPTVLGTVAHDPTAWTEGLELADGELYESTGLVGHSQLRVLDPATGRVLRAEAVPGDRYGEGLTVLGGRIWQLTYTDHVVLPWDRATLRAGAPLPYQGEGWGLCHTAGGALVASDGSDRLRILSGTDLHQIATVAVRIAGRPLPALNELECLPGPAGDPSAGTVWANVYQTDYLVRIELATGVVTGVVDASALVGPAARAEPREQVLNGIAAIPGTDEFLLTGKFWPTMFRVRFTPSR